MNKAIEEQTYSKGEIVAGTILRAYYTKHFVHPCLPRDLPWLQSLHLDFYIPQWHVAIEINGAQHYRPVNWTGDEPQAEAEHRFAIQKQNDYKKQLLCNRHGVYLISVDVSHCENKHELFTQIKSQLHEKLDIYLKANKYQTDASDLIHQPSHKTKDGFIKTRSGRLGKRFVANVVIALKKMPNIKLTHDARGTAVYYRRGKDWDIMSPSELTNIQMDIEENFYFDFPKKVLEKGVHVYANQQKGISIISLIKKPFIKAIIHSNAVKIPRKNLEWAWIDCLNKHLHSVKLMQYLDGAYNDISLPWPIKRAHVTNHDAHELSQLSSALGLDITGSDEDDYYDDFTGHEPMCYVRSDERK